MAVWLDLSKRLEQALQADERLHCEAVYHERLPKWLGEVVRSAEGNAGERLPVVVLNSKGRSTDTTLCIVRLCDLERLLVNE